MKTPVPPPRFYLASSHAESAMTRRLAQAFARQLERESGWVCCARWVHRRGVREDHDEVQVAREDMADVAEAEALVLLSGLTRTCAKWVEFGLALGRGIPIVFVRRWNENALREERPVFVALPQVREVEQTGVVPMLHTLEELVARRRAETQGGED